MGCAKELAKEGSEEKQLILKYLETVSSVRDIYPCVQICKVENMFESKHKRLCVKVIPPPVELSMKEGAVVQKEMNIISAYSIWPTVRAVLAKGDKSWKVLPGMAPTGAQARKAQKLLDAMPSAIEEGV